MREKIISKLVEVYKIEKKIILQLINSNQKITPYTKVNVKNRVVINKSCISTEEQVVLDYYKYLINSYSHITFPNRSYIMTELMSILPYLHFYKSYTIYKFDFEGFFYNIDPRESYKHLCKSVTLRQVEKSFLNNYTNTIKEYLPGIGLHNSLVEISGQNFDFEVKKMFRKMGFIYYARYVDDCILILDEKISEAQVESIILKLMKKCFGSNLTLNSSKTDFYNSEDSNYCIDYLGYVFQKGQSPRNQFKFGIAKKKLDKYNDKINSFILEYKQTNDVELLSFKLELLFKRIVFFGDKKSDKKYRWQVRGISDSYKELKRFMNKNDLNKITNDTQKLFNKSITVCFYKNKVNIPPKIKNQIVNDKFIASFVNNKALLLHRKIGLSTEEMKKRVNRLYSGNLENLSYNELAILLLNRIK